MKKVCVTTNNEMKRNLYKLHINNDGIRLNEFDEINFRIIIFVYYMYIISDYIRCDV